MKRLSKETPNLPFALVTHCLDDNDFGLSPSRRRSRGGWLGGDWRMPFYERAAEQSKMTLDDLYDDDFITSFAESSMRDAAMRLATATDWPYDWTSGRVYRDLEDERSAMIELLSRLR